MKLKFFTLLFSIIVLLELYFGSDASLTVFRYFSKPSIVIALIVFFMINAKNVSKVIKNTILLALFFSLLGDVLLLFDTKSEYFFIFGLVAFLIAHIMYCIAFLKERNTKRNPLLIIALLLGYAVLLFLKIKSSLGTMLVPVTAYMIVILSMAISAYLRKGNVTTIGYYLVFIGAVFFMISDSILAVNKFHTALPYSNISIMLTYAIAQFLIVVGILKSRE